MNRLEAIRAIINNLQGGELITHANGDISRESFNTMNRKENFYMLGSMGLASSIALGIAVSQPDRKVIVLDGDGNLLMGLGNLAHIGAIKPKNLTHFVLDNRVYGTTGDQPTISPQTPLFHMASAAGYATSLHTDNLGLLERAFKASQTIPGPHFIHILVNQEVCEDCSRIPYPAQQIKNRFISALNP